MKDNRSTTISANGRSATSGGARSICSESSSRTATVSCTRSRTLAHVRVGFGLERVQLTVPVRLDDSLQVLLAPPLVALRPFAEIAVLPLCLA